MKAGGMQAGVAVAAAVWVLAGLGCQQPPPTEGSASVEPVEIDAERGNPTILREGFSTPESAVYDAEQDVYFISNINGAPMATDDNGYITRVDAATGEITARWIDGLAEDVTLHGPRGLSVAGDRLWAADVDALRSFDKFTGESVDVIAIPEGIFLNDVFALPDGTVYLSDLGMAGETEGEDGAAMDSVYRIAPDQQVEVIAARQELHRPDGLWVHNGELWVAAFGSAEVYRLSNGEKADVQRLPQGVLDGLMWLEDGTFLVSSWDANGIYRGAPGGPYELVVEGVNSPADFGYDSKRGLLIVPYLDESMVGLHTLE